MNKKLEKTAESANKRKYVVFLPYSGVDIEGYGKIPKIGGTSASSEKDAIGHYLFRLTGNSRFYSGLISERNAKIIIGTLNSRGFLGAERYAYEVPEFCQTPEDLRRGKKMGKESFKMLQKLRTADYFENLFGRRITDEEYEMIGRAID